MPSLLWQLSRSHIKGSLRGKTSVQSLSGFFSFSWDSEQIFFLLIFSFDFFETRVNSESNPLVIWPTGQFLVFELQHQYYMGVSMHIYLCPKSKEGTYINLAGVGVGNGLTDPVVQYRYTPPWQGITTFLDFLGGDIYEIGWPRSYSHQDTEAYHVNMLTHTATYPLLKD
jgi:hypothetical protein